MNTPKFKLYELANSRYNVDAHQRRYHTINHALDVVQNVIELSGGNAPTSLELAALYHDAVYFPGIGDNINEKCSEMALKFDAEFVGFSKDDPDIQEACFLISWTTVDNHLIKTNLVGNIAVLLDADLGSLSLSWERFVKNQINIIIENGGIDSAENRHKSAEFLSKFMTCRQYIYHTEFARNNWENLARGNIVRWVKENF